MADELYEVTVFSNDHEHKIRGGVVYISAQLTREQVNALLEREQERGHWCKVEAMS